jgi:multisubunit Na+/H+ antiporter MnhC subunit
MFIGHFGLGFATKKIAPNVSLGTSLMAVQFLDLVWPTLLLLDVEHVVIHPELGGTRTLEFSDYPISHSLLLAIGWSILFGGVYWLIRKDRRSAFILGLAVLSHWVLDLVVHFHDLPLFPWASAKVGFGVWGSAVVTNILEGLLFGTGVYLYLRATIAKNKTARIVFWTLVVLLLLVQVSSLVGPPPENVAMLAWSAQFQWLFVALGYWADRHTVPNQNS